MGWYGEGVAVEGERCQDTGVEENGAAAVEEAARCRLQRLVQLQGWADRFLFKYAEPAGVLSVAGTAPSFYVKQLVQIALKDIKGVRRIDNRLQVVSLLTANNAGSRIDGAHFKAVGGGGQYDGREQHRT
jgi:hypothetical protein